MTPAEKVHALLSKRDRFHFQRFVNRLRERIADSGYGNCVLKEYEALSIVRLELLRDDEGDWHMSDFIIMPNHVHLLMVPARAELEECMKRIKGRSATACNQRLQQSGRMWQPDSFDHIVRTIEHLWRFRDYIACNPARAGITVHEQAYYRADWP